MPTYAYSYGHLEVICAPSSVKTLFYVDIRIRVEPVVMSVVHSFVPMAPPIHSWTLGSGRITSERTRAGSLPTGEGGGRGI
jgi:hypothetical protein